MGSLLMLLSFRLFHQQQPDTIALCKDIFYVFEVHPEYRFRYISPSLDDHIGKGVATASYMDPDQCFARIHPEDIEVLMPTVTTINRSGNAGGQMTGRTSGSKNMRHPFAKTDRLLPSKG